MRHRLLFVLLFAGLTDSFGYSPNLPPDPHLDRLLLRLSSQYNVPLPPALYMQPLSYADVRSFIERIDSLHSNDSVFTDTERRCMYQLDKRYGFTKAAYAWSAKNDNIHLKINCNLLGDVRPRYSDSATMNLFGIVAPSLAGNMGKLSFYSGVRVWTEYRSDTLFPFPSYEPYNGIAYNLYGRSARSSVRSSDVPHGGIAYDAGRIRLETAIDYLKSGPAQFFPLTLSGTAPPVTFFKATCDLDKIFYTHVVGLLKSQKNRRKFLFMHRLDADLWQHRLHLGISESVVYGNTTTQPHSSTDSILPQYRQDDRAIDWEYCIPFLPFKFIEHYSGDRDNALISVDLSLSWPPQWRWYGEFLLDDMLSPWKLFTNDWGNKWAFTLGGGWYGMLLKRDVTIQAECSRIEPWVYTHFSGGSHRYTHFNASLGSPNGPNSLASAVVALISIHPLHEIGIGIQQRASNSEARGGTITDVFQYKDPVDTFNYHDATTKVFLGTGTTWKAQPSLYWNFNRFGRFSLDAVLCVEVLHDPVVWQFAISGGLFF